MKKFVVYCFCFALFSCDDGDLQIETLDFDSITKIEDCGDIKIDQVNVLFKINDDEALILTLPSGILKNEVSEGKITSAVPSASKITYRIFSDKVTSNYFCDAIPLKEPTVINEIEAKGGNVFITTTTTDNVTYSHEIELSEISLETSDSSRITDLRINKYGTVTTKVE